MAFSGTVSACGETTANFSERAWKKVYSNSCLETFSPALRAWS